MKKIKHYFLSANTNEGFWSYFDNVNSKNKEGFTYILKGGPGSGKSTLMKRIGEYFLGMGEAVEYFHCSSDPVSLDGVHLIDKNVSIVDGTSPHVVEASVPSANSKIVNLGEFISLDVKKNYHEIMDLYKSKSDCYNNINKLLSCAGILYDMNNKIEEEYLDKNKIDKLYLKLTSKYIKQEENIKLWTKRDLFRTVIGDSGEINYDKQNYFKHVLKVNLGVFGANILFEKLTSQFLNNGREVICFHDYLNPKMISSILVNDDFLIERENTNVKIEDYAILDSFITNQNMIESILEQVSKYLSKAKSYHFKVENIYNSFIDFDLILSKTAQIISEIKTNF